MNIAVIGAGYVGTTTSVAFAEYGHKVIVVDHDLKKIEKLQQSILPFYEEGIEDLLKVLITKGNISFTENVNSAINQSDLLFITVGTPSLDDGVADISYVEEVARTIGQHMNDHKIIVIKSTVPIGTGDKVKDIINEELANRNKQIPFDVVSNPEFLREGKALHDARYPERIVIGCESKKAEKEMKDLYKEVNTQLLITSVKDAEMIKYASNTFLATKISFINELARLCEKMGVDITNVAKGMGLDSRIGPQFLHAGIGYGGSCFPKDVKALKALSLQEKTPLHILEAVTYINDTQAEWFMQKVKNTLGDLSGKRIAILGLTFKPDTDDIREASSIKIIDFLIKNHAVISAYDPKGIEHVKKIFPSITYTSTPFEALQGADAIILVTEWKDIIEIDWKAAKNSMNQPFLFDGRNALNASRMVKLGYSYFGVGLPAN
jgi:UDPglucose 6-dehydrogenase